MVLIQIMQAAVEGDVDTAAQASFFGFIGIACALVFASKYKKKHDHLKV